MRQRNPIINIKSAYFLSFCSHLSEMNGFDWLIGCSRVIAFRNPGAQPGTQAYSKPGDADLKTAAESSPLSARLCFRMSRSCRDIAADNF